MLATAATFLLLFWRPLVLLGADWWNDPEAGHGLLLAPLALWLAWRRGLVAPAPERAAGLALLVAAVLLRYVSELAAELFTMRASMLLALVGLLLFFRGWRQILAWWLPLALLALSIPLPDVILGALAHPLQLVASRLGAAMLEARHVPVMLSGNIIHLPGRDLFVTEACSGLRSLTALLALGVLVAGTALRHPASRAILLACAIPIAVLVNGARVFVTGFVVFFVSPAAGEGILHLTEGWLMFLGAFGVLALLAWAGSRLERRLSGTTVNA